MRTWKTYLLEIGKLCIFVGVWSFMKCEMAYSVTLELGDISSAYSNCTFKSNGNGTSTVSTVVDYKEIKRVCGIGCKDPYAGRGLIIYAYDKNGKPKASSFAATSVKLNGVDNYGRYLGEGYSIYQNNYRHYPWGSMSQFSATFTAIIPDSNFSAWPAISLRAANVGILGTTNDTAEIKGAAYIATSSSNDGTCKVIVNPETPPPPDINISVSAPDWNLGELQQGLSDTRLSRADQMLCFSYDAADVQGGKFIIGASNANGVVNNRYQLRHLSDTTQVVPYRLTLDSGSTLIKLPDNSNALPLGGAGRTCFIPTFTTEVGKAVKEGDYSDVLTFTITTKS
ncbi:hypothetical protein GNF76_04930 [Pseudomonas sp. CCM 7893]|uniref:Fimbrial protein n=1 Tax=Pseudomonas spelaei TaxID=1055469 RepID=A0A6I3W0L8_9PSED|nr:hypothetical protein [Pseudomonas spelaei]MUF03665.1 hypothetical protein [Pseudomonas spelaei]